MAGGEDVIMGEKLSNQLIPQGYNKDLPMTFWIFPRTSRVAIITNAHSKLIGGVVQIEYRQCGPPYNLHDDNHHHMIRLGKHTVAHHGADITNIVPFSLTHLNRFVVARDHDIHGRQVFNLEVIQTELGSAYLVPDQEVGDERSAKHDEGLRDNERERQGQSGGCGDKTLPPPDEVEDLSGLSQDHPQSVM